MTVAPARLPRVTLALRNAAKGWNRVGTQT